MSQVSVVVVVVPVVIDRDVVASGQMLGKALDAVCECCEVELKKADPDGDLAWLPNFFPLIRKRIREALDL